MFSSCAKDFVRVIGLLALCMVFTVSATAQSTTTGAIGGVVTDQSGAVIPNAKIDIRNTGTNAVATTTSDEGGRYRAVNLDPGTYEVKATAGGFSDYKGTVVVEVGRLTNVEAKMNVTGKGETVEVVGDAPVINTERQDFANNIDQAAIQNLPINGRRWSNYALLTPTANPDGNFGLISFRGMAGIANNSTVDGGDNNSNFYGEERGRTRLSYSTSQDSIREFQVNASNFSAEYGRSAGGVVNTVTKSGTNSYHGSGYYYIRDNALGATNPSSFLNGAPYKAEDRRQQFGATLGGPIMKDRVFFFFNYDQQKRNFPGVAIPLTGTNGYASGAPVAASTPFVAAGPNPLTSPAIAAGACPTNGTTPASYTVGNILYCRFGSVAAGNQAAADGYAFFTNLLGVNPRKGEQLLFFPKVDIKVWGGNWATSYNWLNWTSPSGIQTQPTNAQSRDSFGSDLVRSRVVNSIFNKALNAKTAMELRFHWSTENLSGDFQTPLPGQPSVAGVTGSHPPGVNVAAWLNFGTRDYLPRLNNPQENQYQYAGNLVYSSGKHTWKFGTEYLHQTELVNSLSRGYGEFGYTGNFSFVNFLSDAYNTTTRDFTGSGVRRCGTVASGLPGGTGTTPCYATLDQSLGTLGYNFTTNDYAMFIQDDWKIYPRLNLHLGVRYENQRFPKPQFVNPLLPSLTNEQPEDNNNFAPRLGFAYDILGNGKLVFRGGYGLYYGRIINSTIAAGLVNTGVANAQPAYRVSASATSPVYPNLLAAAPSLTPDVVYYDARFHNPVIHQGDAIVEWEFLKNTVASFSYLNSRGRGLINFLDQNLPASYQGTNTFTRPDGSTFTIPTYGTLARPNTSFGRITAIANEVDSDYSAFVAQVTRKLTNGWQIQSSYTFSRATDNGQNSTTFSTGNNALDPQRPGLEYGRSNYDVPHKFIFAAIWQPMYFKDSNKTAHYILDDWTLAPIVNLSSGFAFTGTIGGTLPSTVPPAGGAATANCASSHSAGINCASPGLNRAPDVEKNTFRSPKRQTVDFRISRHFKITEGTKLEFITEAFNLFNHPNVSGMNSGQFNVGTCTGHSTGNNLSCTLTSNATFNTPSAKDGGTNLRERQIQFAVRFIF